MAERYFNSNIIANFWGQFQNIEPQTVIDTIEFRKFSHIKYDKVLILSGAGMSQESDLPLFFSNTTTLHDKTQKELIDLFNSRKPHEGYAKLLEFCKDKDYYVMTSNIDGYFLRTGFDSNRIMEVHGNVFDYQCPNRCEQKVYKYVDSTNPLEGSHSKCEYCGELLVPNVMRCGFENWIYKHESIEKEMEKDMNTSTSNEWLIIEIGAGINVPVIRDYSEILVEDKKYSLIRINPVHYQIPRDILSKTTIRIPYNAIQGIDIMLSYLNKK